MSEDTLFGSVKTYVTAKQRKEYSDKKRWKNCSNALLKNNWVNLYPYLWRFTKTHEFLDFFLKTLTIFLNNRKTAKVPIKVLSNCNKCQDETKNSFNLLSKSFEILIEFNFKYDTISVAQSTEMLYSFFIELFFY